MTVGGTSSSLDQTTGEAAVMREAVNKSATHPVEGPGTDVKQQNATQPVEAPGAGTAPQPVEAPGVGPEVLLSGAGETVLQADSDYELQSEPSFLVDANDRLPRQRLQQGKIPVTKTSLKMLPAERQSEG